MLKEPVQSAVSVCTAMTVGATSSKMLPNDPCGVYNQLPTNKSNAPHSSSCLCLRNFTIWAEGSRDTVQRLQALCLNVFGHVVSAFRSENKYTTQSEAITVTREIRLNQLRRHCASLTCFERGRRTPSFVMSGIPLLLARSTLLRPRRGGDSCGWVIFFH
mgnify:FL=1